MKTPWLPALAWTLISPLVGFCMLLIFSILFVEHVDGGFVEVWTLRFNDAVGGPLFMTLMLIATAVRFWYIACPLLYGCNVVHTVAGQRLIKRMWLRNLIAAVIAGVIFLFIVITISNISGYPDLGIE